MNRLKKCLAIFFYLFRIFSIDENKVIFSNFYGKGYGDNPKYIAEKLLERNHKIKIVWMVSRNEKSKFPSNVKAVKINSIKWFYEMVTAKVWVNNVRFPAYIRKRKGQYYIQMWHGGLGLKKIEKDIEAELSDSYIEMAKRDSSMIDCMISNCSHIHRIYEKSFWYDGEIQDLGYPKNDIFFKKKENIERLNREIRDKYGIPYNKKIILYAPTFRNTDKFDYFSINHKQLLKSLESKNKSEYVYSVKLHPNLKGKYKIQDEDIIDFTDFPDVDELLLITDIIISDYSSVFFDFIFLDRPIYLYAPDYEEYIGTRGTYYEYLKLPFSISQCSEDLINAIVNDEFSSKKAELSEFINKNGLIDDGHASERVCDFIEEKL